MRFHFETDRGIGTLDPDETERPAGENSHYHRGDLWTAIDGVLLDADGQGRAGL